MSVSNIIRKLFNKDIVVKYTNEYFVPGFTIGKKYIAREGTRVEFGFEHKYLVITDDNGEERLVSSYKFKH